MEQNLTGMKIVLGHSFVRNYAKHLAKIHHTKMLPRHIAYYTKTHKHVAGVKLLGHGGATTELWKEKLLESMLPLAADAVCIDLGTNDLMQGKDPQQLVDDLMELANIITRNEQIKVVCFIAIIPRISNRRGVSSNTFRQQALEVNRLLRLTANTGGKIMFQQVDGVWTEDGRPHHCFRRNFFEFSHDGIHLTKPKGRKIYHRTLQSALLRTSGRIRGERRRTLEQLENFRDIGYTIYLTQTHCNIIIRP